METRAIFNGSEKPLPRIQEALALYGQEPTGSDKFLTENLDNLGVGLNMLRTPGGNQELFLVLVRGHCWVVRLKERRIPGYRTLRRQ